MSILPYDIQKASSQLCIQKPLFKDVDGILLLIMIAGTGFKKEEKKYLQKEIIGKVGKDEFTFLMDCQQIVLVLLFGIMLDDVS